MRPALAVLVLALLAAPPALAQVTTDPVTFVTYRPWPDPRAASADADPLASGLAPPPREIDRLPYTLVDRAVLADRAPENAPESALAHYRHLSRLVQDREAQGAPLTLTLEGRVEVGELVTIVSASAASNVTVVIVEHGPAPYAARFVLAPAPVDAGGSLRQTVRLDPAWDVDRLGFVAIAESAEGTQSATWLVQRDAATTQARKAVLVEHVTASWCDPCRPVDEALALLQAQRAVAGALDTGGTPSYLRAPGATFYLGALLGGVAAIALLRRRP